MKFNFWIDLALDSISLKTPGEFSIVGLFAPRNTELFWRFSSIFVTKRGQHHNNISCKEIPASKKHFENYLSTSFDTKLSAIYDFLR